MWLVVDEKIWFDKITTRKEDIYDGFSQRKKKQWG